MTRNVANTRELTFLVPVRKCGACGEGGRVDTSCQKFSSDTGLTVGWSGACERSLMSCIGCCQRERYERNITGFSL